MRSVNALLLMAALGFWSSCISKPPEGRLRCSRDAECPSGWSCRDNQRCYATPAPPAADSGSGTSSTKDDAGAPTEPAMLQDSGPADAGKPQLDAGRPKPSAGAGGQSGSTGGAGAAGSDAGTSTPDAGEPVVPVQMIALGAYGCSASNTLCERSAECTSDRCLITTCETAGTFCDGPAECCDLACNGGLCKCGNHSAACSASTSPCCGNLYCETGQCASCKAQGASCAGAYQCCGTTDCYSGVCQCRPMGASCDSQSVCCAGTRCDGGQCTCRAEGVACDGNSTCCSGLRCSGGMCAVAIGRPIDPSIFGPIKNPILWACLNSAIGEACSTSADCCSQNCFDGKCVEACRKVGEEAEVDSQCCSRLRANGKCAYASCYATAQACTAHQNCCSGRCVASQCAP